MKVFKDIITETEVGSDIYICNKEESREGVSENFVVLEGTMATISNDGNCGFDDEEEEVGASNQVRGINIVHNYNLFDIQPKSGKDAMNIIKDYMKRLLKVKSKSLKEGEDITEWKNTISKDFMKMYKKWDEYSWYVPSISNNHEYSSGLDGILIFMKWHDDGKGAYLYYHKDAFVQESC